MADSSKHVGFPSTTWTCIRAVQNCEHPEHGPAVNRFMLTYWKPVFYYLRARGQPFHQAQDLTQDFFVRFVLERKWVDDADPGKGRFRGFLLTVLKRFVADQGGNRVRRQVQFERQFVAIARLISDDERSFEPSAADTPEAIFTRQWAQSVLNAVTRQLRERFGEENRLAWVELFEAYHCSAGKRPSQQALAAQFGLSRDQVRDILDKVQKRLDRLLRSEIRDQVGSEADIDEEIRELKAVML